MASVNNHNSNCVRKIVVRGINPAQNDYENRNSRKKEENVLECSDLSPSSLVLLDPSILSETRLSELLKLHRIPLKSNETKQELLELFEKHVHPKPQRTKAECPSERHHFGSNPKPGVVAGRPGKRAPDADEPQGSPRKKTAAFSAKDSSLPSSDGESVKDNSVDVCSSRCIPLKRAPSKVSELKLHW